MVSEAELVQKYGLTKRQLLAKAKEARVDGYGIVAAILTDAANGHVYEKPKSWLDKVKDWFYASKD